ncbi:MAG: DUF1801 domain-containing protein [Cytophagales bacterium]|nr:DUF1801 domain-containing protein [Cytophagales bacterium]
MKTVSNYILGLEGQQNAIVSFLHERLTNYHDLQSKISYGIPMYKMKTWVCYLNPIKTGGVDFVFTRGQSLSNEQGLLNSKGRKQVAGFVLQSVSEIPERAIDEMVQEAILVDELWVKERRKR